MTVHARGGFSTAPLEAGEHLIGNVPGCSIQVELPAPCLAGRLRVTAEGPTLEVVSDVVTLDGRRAEPGHQEPLRSGTSLQVGQTLLLVQKRRSSAPRRLWPHGSFEMLLEAECLRAEQNQASFSLLRLRLAASGSGAGEEILGNQLRLSDVLGVYGPGEYEALLPDTGAEQGELVRARLLQALRAGGIEVECGIATFPEDGLSPDELAAKTGSAVRGQLSSAAASSLLVLGGDPRLQEAIGRIAASSLSVLISGETGSGKERTAELVHQLSKRAGRPFLKLNCAALSESLIESELFGHERGAFTGAIATKPGLLQTADSGTVFLDEIGELSPSIQAKLLRAIEERQVMRLGGVKPVGVDVRFVSATNRNLEEEVARGTFRIDLYHRVAGAQLWVPPLRERLDELRGLVDALVAAACEREERPLMMVSDEALDLMRRYPWPGNIRELRNVMERAVLLATEGVITPAHLPVEKLRASFSARRVTSSGSGGHTRTGTRSSTSGVRSAHTPTPGSSAPPPSAPAAPPSDLKDSIRALERTRIQQALAEAGGNQTRAAQALGISRRTLVSRLGELGFPRPRKRSEPDR